jgi:L-ascorbate 6-phosphate lactonase
MQQRSLTWLGQAGFCLEAEGLRILIDPFLSDHEARMFVPPDAAPLATGVDWVLVTHEHLDHFDKDFLRTVERHSPKATLVLPSPLVGEASAVAPLLDVIGIRPGDRLFLSPAVGLHVVPAWHGFEVADGYTQGHTADGACRYVGYVVRLPGCAVYHSGDTIITDELRAALAAERIDVALLPVNGRDYYRESIGLVGNMDAREAVALAGELDIEMLIPMHWDMFAGNTVRPALVIDEIPQDTTMHVLTPARFVPIRLPGGESSGRREP